MRRQTLTTAIETKNGVIHRIGRGSIYTPKPKFGGGSVKWYEDKTRQQEKG